MGASQFQMNQGHVRTRREVLAVPPRGQRLSLSWFELHRLPRSHHGFESQGLLSCPDLPHAVRGRRGFLGKTGRNAHRIALGQGGSPYWRGRNRHAETMNAPNSAASIRYSGQWALRTFTRLSGEGTVDALSAACFSRNQWVHPRPFAKEALVAPR